MSVTHLVFMVTSVTERFSVGPQPKSGIKWQVFETLDLAEEEETLYLILFGRRRRQRTKRLWSVHPIKWRREEQGDHVLVDQMREMDEERHFQYFTMSK